MLCERIFSRVKQLISPNHNQLAGDIIEAAECLRIWWIRALSKNREKRYNRGGGDDESGSELATTK
jgi:hypothetical protein